jgi:hypothetical protein
MAKLLVSDGLWERRSPPGTSIRSTIGWGPANHRDGAMTKDAVMYERRGKLFVRTSSRTTTGLWLEVGDCTSLDASASPEEIGEAVGSHLAASTSGLPHPLSFSRNDEISGPLLRAAGVGSWVTFERLAKSVQIEAEGDRLKISPTKNNRPGFTVIDEGVVQLPIESDSRVLGEHLKQALAASK